MTLTSETKIVTGIDGRAYTVTDWFEDSNWFQASSRSPWEKYFVIIPRRSHLSDKLIWGKCCKRSVRHTVRNREGPSLKHMEYVTRKEAFEDRLKGAV